MARTQGSRAEITGPAVRDAARRLFARHGFAAVSMRQIAAEVGVQAGALYAYTPDKQALLADLLESHMQELLDAWSDDPAADPLARLRRAGKPPKPERPAELPKHPDRRQARGYVQPGRGGRPPPPPVRPGGRGRR